MKISTGSPTSIRLIKARTVLSVLEHKADVNELERVELRNKLDQARDEMHAAITAFQDEVIRLGTKDDEGGSREAVPNGLGASAAGPGEVQERKEIPKNPRGIWGIGNKGGAQ